MLVASDHGTSGLRVSGSDPVALGQRHPPQAGRNRRCRRLRTCFAQTAEPDAEQVKQVLPIARHELQTAVTIVAPAHTDLFNAIAAPLRQVENLDVEHVTVNALAAE